MKELYRKKIRDILEQKETEKEIIVKGWVRTKRGNNKIAFIAINDGSIVHNLQVVADVPKFKEEILEKMSTGTCIEVRGKLAESPGKGQEVELHADEITLYGPADPETYPLQKKGHSLEFLREIAHLRPRTNTFGAILRLRHHLSYAIHKYFNDKGFYYMHTPIITGSDCEGAGEMFRVTTLDPKSPPLTKDGKVDFNEDFFGKETNLTVSGQLEGETGALALSTIYTFGPTFRAENSNTPRHLAEFWMIEPEMAFYDIHDNMDLAEDLLKYLIRYILDHCMTDLEFLQKMYDDGLIERLDFVLAHDFVRTVYSEAIEILKKADQPFEFPVEWGKDLQSEHER